MSLFFLHSFIHTISLKVSTPTWLIPKDSVRSRTGFDSKPPYNGSAPTTELRGKLWCDEAQIKRITLIVFFVLFSISMYLAEFGRQYVYYNEH